jgi:hypothetical protein
MDVILGQAHNERDERQINVGLPQNSYGYPENTPTSQYAFPVTVTIGAPINFSFLSELV